MMSLARLMIFLLVGVLSSAAALSERELALSERELALREREVALREREMALNERELELRERRATAGPAPSHVASFGVATKHGKCAGLREVTVFEHTVSSTGSHGVITSMWHGGTRGDPRMRVYVDAELDGDSVDPAVDYTVALAHGLAPEDNATWPWQSRLFGRTHFMGYFNEYQIPFSERVRVTIQCDNSSDFFYRVAGAENWPITIGAMIVRPSTRLRIVKFGTNQVRATYT